MSIRLAPTSDFLPEVRENYSHADMAYALNSSYVVNELRLFKVTEILPDRTMARLVVIQRHTVKLLSTIGRSDALAAIHGQLSGVAEVNKADKEYVIENGKIAKDIYIAWAVSDAPSALGFLPAAFCVLPADESCESIDALLFNEKFVDSLTGYFGQYRRYIKPESMEVGEDYVAPLAKFHIEEQPAQVGHVTQIFDYMCLTFTNAKVMMSSGLADTLSAYPTYNRNGSTRTAKPTVQPHIPNVTQIGIVEMVGEEAMPLAVLHSRFWCEEVVATTVVNDGCGKRLLIATLPFSADHVRVQMQLVKQEEGSPGEN